MWQKNLEVRLEYQKNGGGVMGKRDLKADLELLLPEDMEVLGDE